MIVPCVIEKLPLKNYTVELPYKVNEMVDAINRLETKIKELEQHERDKRNESRVSGSARKH
jgi:hypothetical protein